jgi:hypothetical protein
MKIVTFGARQRASINQAATNPGACRPSRPGKSKFEFANDGWFASLSLQPPNLFSTG